MREVSLKAEMIPLLQTLADPMNLAQTAFDQAKVALEQRRKIWSDGLAMCAFQLGLRPDQIEGFDVSKAVFIVRERPDESSAPPSAAVPSAPPSPEPSLRTAAQSDLEGTPAPLAP